MNYKKIYDLLIDRAVNRNLDKKELFEIHHIIPKSLGGSNSKSNLCKLTLKEHFFAHLLLTKIYPDCPKMHGALWSMCITKNERYKPSSRLYEQIRFNYREICKGENHHFYGKKQSVNQIKNASEGRAKKVYQYNLNGLYIKTWDSLKQASDYLNFSAPTISRCCLGTSGVISYKGYRWSYQYKDMLEPMNRIRKSKHLKLQLI